MFDIGWQELFIVAILALIVVGPKDLPRAIRAVTGAIRKVRGMAREFQSGLDEVAREAELDDLKRQMTQASDYDITKEIKDNLDPDGEIEKTADIEKDIRSSMNETAEKMKSETAAPEPSVPEPAPSETGADMAAAEATPVETEAALEGEADKSKAASG